MAEEGEQGGGEDPRVELLKQYTLKTIKQVSSEELRQSIIIP